MPETIVEAIEGGKIVVVPESYAKQEGLPILRKSQLTKLQENVTNLPPSTTSPKEEEKRLLEYSKIHSNWRDKQVISELVDNWHWIIRIERKKKGLTRKQFARLINEPENELKLLESGILRKKDFVLINKIQQSLGINIRKDKRNFSNSITDIYPKETPPKKDNTASKGIEILDEEI